ncbi:hypothetical protein ACVNP0_15740 [Staphylococcus aureus]
MITYELSTPVKSNHYVKKVQYPQGYQANTVITRPLNETLKVLVPKLSRSFQ